ncbi:MAG: type I 3-dehydroquinate dehydratase [Verrucomicrobiales bacterium]|nr:type I 3-dehydroquinate dehydratase [Verrucomicrobiales bacterium]
MPQLLSSSQLFLSQRPLVVGVVSDAETLASWLALSEEARARSCDVVELRLDTVALEGGELKERVREVTQPLLVTARHPAEGGAASERAAERAAMLEPWLDRAAAMDVELRSLGEMRDLVRRAQAAGVGVAGSFHDFQRTPSDEILEGAAGLAEAAGVDLVKVATYLNSPEDLARLIRFVSAERRVRVSAMGMGPLGRVSRLVLAKCGSLLNYGYLGTQSNAEGQWPAEDLKSLMQKV